MFSHDRLHALALTDVPTISALLAAPFEELLPHSVDTVNRRAHFLAQVCFESGYFGRLVENLYYTHASRIAAVWPRLSPRADSLVRNPEALGNAAYANHLGNGNEASGDGYKYRGRGLIQLTGRSNYAHHGSLANIDILNHPDLAADPHNAVVLALAYWNANHCNDDADRDDVAAVTKKINGPAMLGLAERRTLTNRAKGIFV